MKGCGVIDYSFNDEEIKSLSRYMRNGNPVPGAELDNFRCFLEKYIYRIMTIEEAEAFFNE